MSRRRQRGRHRGRFSGRAGRRARAVGIRGWGKRSHCPQRSMARKESSLDRDECGHAIKEPSAPKTGSAKRLPGRLRTQRGRAGGQQEIGGSVENGVRQRFTDRRKSTRTENRWWIADSSGRPSERAHRATERGWLRIAIDETGAHDELRHSREAEAVGQLGSIGRLLEGLRHGMHPDPLLAREQGKAFVHAARGQDRALALVAAGDDEPAVQRARKRASGYPEGGLGPRATSAIGAPRPLPPERSMAQARPCASAEIARFSMNPPSDSRSSRPAGSTSGSVRARSSWTVSREGSWTTTRHGWELWLLGASAASPRTWTRISGMPGVEPGGWGRTSRLSMAEAQPARPLPTIAPAPAAPASSRSCRRWRSITRRGTLACHTRRMPPARRPKMSSVSRTSCAATRRPRKRCGLGGEAGALYNDFKYSTRSVRSCAARSTLRTFS